MSNEIKQLMASYQLGCVRLGDLEMQKQRIEEEIATVRQSLKSLSMTIDIQKQQEAAVAKMAAETALKAAAEKTEK